MPGRRAFLIGCGCFATVPVFAEIWPHGASGDAARSLPAVTPTQSTSVNSATAESIAMRIDGWESPGEAGRARGSHAWVRINSSWRADWR
jgi:hypothetical protein